MILKSFCFLNTVDQWGGGERWHLDIAMHLRSKGYDVIIITQPRSVLGERAQKEGIKVFYSVDKLECFESFCIVQIIKYFSVKSS